MTIGVVIPSKSNLEGLGNVLRDIQADTDGMAEVVVIDNGYTQLTCNADNTFIIRDTTPSIYALWNNGWRYLWELGCSHVVFLNDDVRLLGAGENWLARLTRPLYYGAAVTYPDYTGELGAHEELDTVGTYRHGGMCGYAFAVDVQECLELRALPFDEKYAWWYGDDAFAFSVERGGGHITRVGGIGVEHAESTTLNKSDVGSAIAQDTVRFRALWGDR